MSAIFQGASMLHVEVLDYDTVVVTSMSAMFQGESKFNGDISS